MQYKTIVLELLQQQVELHEYLKSNNSLLSTMNQMAIELREYHLQILSELKEHQPEMPQEQANAQAFEIALSQLEESFLTLKASLSIE